MNTGITSGMFIMLGMRPIRREMNKPQAVMLISFAFFFLWFNNVPDWLWQNKRSKNNSSVHGFHSFTVRPSGDDDDDDDDDRS